GRVLSRDRLRPRRDQARREGQHPHHPIDAQRLTGAGATRGRRADVPAQGERMSEFWLLDENRQPVPARDVIEWAQAFEQEKRRRVGYTEFEDGRWVSTVFIGLDQRFLGSGPPLLFETAVFDDYGVNIMCRYSSWDDAEAGHKATVKRLGGKVTF